MNEFQVVNKERFISVVESTLNIIPSIDESYINPANSMSITYEDTFKKSVNRRISKMNRHAIRGLNLSLFINNEL